MIRLKTNNLLNFHFKRNFWINYYKDASDTLNDIYSLINVDTISPNNINFKEYFTKMDNRLKDFRSMFEYYESSTKTFAPSTQNFYG